MRTAIVELSGGPGSGKSTLAAGLFSWLKLKGVNAELVTEYAKDLTWEGHTDKLQCQEAVFGEQVWRIERLLGKVQVIVTDSPVWMSQLYAPVISQPAYSQLISAVYSRWNSKATVFTVSVLRTKKFEQAGRNQTLAESIRLDADIKRMALGRDSGFMVTGDIVGIEELIEEFERRYQSVFYR